MYEHTNYLYNQNTRFLSQLSILALYLVEIN